MTRSFVHPCQADQTLASLRPSTPDEIRHMARQAGLDLPEPLMAELCAAYPAFEAMVRRVPRRRERFDEPAHLADVAHLAAMEKGR